MAFGWVLLVGWRLACDLNHVEDTSRIAPMFTKSM
jgi:hypothetical protein